VSAAPDPATPDTRSLFSQVSALVPAGPGHFEATVDPNWTIADRPNGGYLLAMLGRAAATASPHDHVVAASAYYLRAPQPGPVTIDVRLLREGRSASHVRGSMVQDGTCVEALFIMSRLDPNASPYWERVLPASIGADYEDCRRLVPRLADGSPVTILDHVEVRLDDDSSGFSRGEPRGGGELRGWMRLPGGEDLDPTSLLYAVDSFPPGTFDIEPSGWVPTLELTVYVRALPGPGPVRVLQRANLIDAQRVDESCYVWDRAGRLVAQGHQLAGVRLG
jgi:acyl-coenzyme A thioesterase PaaI-like protein